jgi:hypothetical protein
MPSDAPGALSGHTATVDDARNGRRLGDRGSTNLEDPRGQANRRQACEALVVAYGGDTYRLLTDLAGLLEASVAYVDRPTVEAHLERRLVHGLDRRRTAPSRRGANAASPRARTGSPGCAPSSRSGRPPVHRGGAEHRLADRHHRAPHRRGQALPLRDQGPPLRPHRRLLDGRPDDRIAGRHRAAQRDRPASAGRPIADLRVKVLRRPVESPNSARPPSCGHWRTTGWSARWAASAPAGTTPRWSPASACCKRTSWTDSAGPAARNYGWQSSPGSRRPTTGAAGNAASDDSPRSNTRHSPTPKPRPDTPPDESTEVGAVPVE